MRRIANANATNCNSNFLTQRERAFHIRKCLQGTESIIDKAMKNYDKTGKLDALEVAFQGYIALGEMLEQVQHVYGHSYGNDFELTK